MRTTEKMKRLFVGAAFAALAATLSMGCDAFLNTEPLGRLTSENFFESEQDALAATNAAYNMLRSFNVHVFSWLGVTEIVTDHATKGSTPTDASFLLAFDNLDWDPNNQAFSGVWEGYYQGIYRANVGIQNIPGIDMDETLRARLVAENKFLRAYYYFFLVRAFGGVPLITEPFDAEDNFERTRAPADSVYLLIEQDLTDAIAALPEQSEYATTELGRATKGAARGLLAKAHLFQKEYPEALAAAEEVINSGEYVLHSDYNFIFSVDGEFSSGSVFEIANIALEEGGGSSQYAQVQGVRGFPNLGWGFNQPSDRLEELYEPGDPRQQATILYPWEIVEEGASVVVHVNANISNQQYNEKVQVPLSTTNSGENPVNIRRLRYADVLLIAAEAAAQAGDVGKAQGYLNQVRQRARGDQTATLGIVPEQLDETIATENLGLASDADRVFVRYVQEGSPADGALQALDADRLDQEGQSVPVLVNSMDIIRSLDGTAVPTLAAYRRAMASKSPGQVVSVAGLRVTQQADGGGVSTSTEAFETDVTAAALLPDVTASGQDLLEAIWEERGSELAMEQHRWFDIVRQGRAAELMNAVGLTFEERYRLYPIPQSEIDLSGGLIEQNEGY